MTTTAELTEALVEAPSALAGFQLVLQLPRLPSQNKQDGAGRWIVHVPVSSPEAVPQLLEDVRMWMRREQIVETRVRVGMDTYRVQREHEQTDLRQKGTDGS
jgi:hypothetical protein